MARGLSVDLPLLGLAVMSMLVYISLALGKFHPVKSRMFLGISGIVYSLKKMKFMFVGVLSVIMATIVGFGVCGLWGVAYSSACFAVPFLILGIGLRFIINQKKNLFFKKELMIWFV